MQSVNGGLAYILTGCIFYVFGVKWCYEYARHWAVIRQDHGVSKGLGLIDKCERLFARLPIEGILKLIATAIGLAGTLMDGIFNMGLMSPKVAYATIYLFFAFSGLVDILNFYFPHNISNGFMKLALAQSFFVEGFLFLWGGIGTSDNINVILAVIVWTTCFAVALELVWPEAKLLTAFCTLLHGGWIAHMVRMYGVTFITENVTLAFSWHIAAALAVTLCIVTVTKSFASRLSRKEPPALPIYDYCQEQDQKL